MGIKDVSPTPVLEGGPHFCIFFSLMFPSSNNVGIHMIKIIIRCQQQPCPIPVPKGPLSSV